MKPTQANYKLISDNLNKMIGAVPVAIGTAKTISKSKEGNINPNGTLSEEHSFSPYIILGSPYKYIGESNWGGLMEYSFSTFASL